MGGKGRTAKTKPACKVKYFKLLKEEYSIWRKRRHEGYLEWWELRWRSWERVTALVARSCSSVCRVASVILCAAGVIGSAAGEVYNWSRGKRRCSSQPGQEVNLPLATDNLLKQDFKIFTKSASAITCIQRKAVASICCFGKFFCLVIPDDLVKRYKQ